MRLRKVHRFTGLVFASFFLITASTGIILLWRKAGIYEKETKELLLGIHNWEITTSYVGAVLATGLLFMTTSGLIILVKHWRRN